MGAIEKFLKKVCVQTAVYWGSPVSDGFGGQTHGEVREIQCRWDDVSNTISTNDGQEIISRAELLVVEDLQEHGFLWLGSLGELNDLYLDSHMDNIDPKTVSNAFEIRRIDKIPMIKSTDDFVRKIYLHG